MKRVIGYKVLIRVFIIMVSIIISFVLLNFNRVDKSLYNQYIIGSEAQLIVQENYVNGRLNELQRNIEYLGKDIEYDLERDIYLLQNFVNDQKSVSDIYLFDGSYDLLGEAGNNHQYRLLIQEEIEGKFFFDNFIWTHLSDSTYLLYYKMPSEMSKYIGLVVDFDELFENISVSTILDVSIINDFGNVVSQSQISRQDNINQLSFRNELLEGHQQTMFVEDAFYSFMPVDFDGSNLFVLYQNSQQQYLNEKRRFIIRNILLSLFMMVFCSLQGWQLIKQLNDIFIRTIVDHNYKVKEFTLLREELNRAIHWVDDVVQHYDELNALKEELIVLQRSIPEEGDQDVKKTTKKN